MGNVSHRVMWSIHGPQLVALFEDALENLEVGTQLEEELAGRPAFEGSIWSPTPSSLVLGQ